MLKSAWKKGLKGGPEAKALNLSAFAARSHTLKLAKLRPGPNSLNFQPIAEVTL
jgi:hypothetical protein